MRSRWTFVLAVLASTLVFTAQAGVASADEASTLAPYRVVDLGTLGGATSQAYAMNDRGQVVGRSDTADGAIHPFLWDRGRMVDLNLLGGFQGTPSSINNRRQVVGSSDVPEGGQHAVLWQDGRIIDLGTLGGPISAAYDINDRGQIVGVSITASYEWHAFLWQNGTMTDLGRFDAHGVNNHTQVTGAIGQPSWGEDVFPVLWDRGRLTVLSTEPGSAAGGINNAGMVTVNITRADGTEHVFVWYRGRLTELPTLGGGAGAGPINDRGQILGWSRPAGGTARPVLWHGTVITDLATLGVHADAFLTALDNRGDLAGSRNGHAVLYRH